MQLSCRFDSLPAPHHTTLMINFPAMMRNVDGINRKLQFIDKLNRAAALMVGKRAEDKKIETSDVRVFRAPIAAFRFKVKQFFNERASNFRKMIN